MWLPLQEHRRPSQYDLNYRYCGRQPLPVTVPKNNEPTRDDPQVVKWESEEERWSAPSDPAQPLSLPCFGAVGTSLVLLWLQSRDLSQPQPHFRLFGQPIVSSQRCSDCSSSSQRYGVEECLTLFRRPLSDRKPFIFSPSDGDGSYGTLHRRLPSRSLLHCRRAPGQPWIHPSDPLLKLFESGQTSPSLESGLDQGGDAMKKSRIFSSGSFERC